MLSRKRGVPVNAHKKRSLDLDIWLNFFAYPLSKLTNSMASMLYFNGVDSVSISKRLGHAQVSTTANIYAHVMEEADKKNADILADVFLKKA